MEIKIIFHREIGMSNGCFRSWDIFTICIWIPNYFTFSQGIRMIKKFNFTNKFRIKIFLFTNLIYDFHFFLKIEFSNLCSNNRCKSCSRISNKLSFSVCYNLILRNIFLHLYITCDYKRFIYILKMYYIVIISSLILKQTNLLKKFHFLGGWKSLLRREQAMNSQTFIHHISLILLNCLNYKKIRIYNQTFLFFKNSSIGMFPLL